MAARTKSSKDRPSYRCTECGWQTAKWLGRCPECQAWGTVEEYGAPAVRTTAPGRVTSSAVPIGEVDVRRATARSTGVPELDRVLGGGLVPGAVVLLAGEPGVGKSTLLLDVAAKAATDDHRTLYVTGEESASQVRLRADRISAIADHLYLAAETDLAAVLGHLDAVKPSLLILDSVQTVASPEIDGAPGGMAQVREVAGALIRASKERGMSTLLVGHVTKDGAIAGPRLLEHLVDVVLHFEGDRHARLRLVRGVKNRYGTTDEVGCFELHDEGSAEGVFVEGERVTEPVGEGMPGQPLGDGRAADVAGADVEDAEAAGCARGSEGTEGHRVLGCLTAARYATPRLRGPQLATSRSGTTLRSSSASSAPARSRTGTLPVTSTMEEGTMPGVGPPSR